MTESHDDEVISRAILETAMCATGALWAYLQRILRLWLLKPVSVFSDGYNHRSERFVAAKDDANSAFRICGLAESCGRQDWSFVHPSSPE